MRGGGKKIHPRTGGVIVVVVLCSFFLSSVGNTSGRLFRIVPTQPQIKGRGSGRGKRRGFNPTCYFSCLRQIQVGKQTKNKGGVGWGGGGDQGGGVASGCGVVMLLFFVSLRDLCVVIFFE